MTKSGRFLVAALLALVAALLAVVDVRSAFAQETPAQETPAADATAAAPANADASAAGTSTWAPFPLDPTGAGDAHTIARGPGWYLSLGKIFAFWIIFAAWVWTTDWVNRDAQSFKLNYTMWNSIVVFPFLATVLLCWLLPMFALGFVLMILAWGGTLGAYIWLRNEQVELHERVLTPDHLRHIFAHKAKKVGVKVDAEKKAAHEQGAPVELAAMGAANDRDNQANLLTARQSPGWVVAKDWIADAVRRRSEVVMYDYSAEAVGVRYQIDGVWHAGTDRDRPGGDAMLAVLKKISALNPDERVAKQSGRFTAGLDGKSFVCRLLSQGSETGERAVIKFDQSRSEFHSLLALGMREKTRDQLLQVMNTGGGLVLFSAMPAGGLSTTTNVTLEESDRLMRSYGAIEEQTQRELEVLNVEVTTYNAAAGQTPVAVIPQALGAYPDVLVVRDLPDAATVTKVCQVVGDDVKMIVSTIRAKEAAEALLRVLMLKPSAQLFASKITAVVGQKLVRTLCESCKVAYPPPPDVLAKLGIPQGRIQSLFREPTAEERPQPCPTCRGIGYLGRTSLFELLVVDNAIRQALVTQPKLDVLRQAARAAGMRSIQEEGILLVAKGQTSLNELMRVLKQ